MSQKKVIVRPVQHLYQLFQHQYMPPNKDWCVELLRKRPDYYPDHYVEDAWVGYVLRPSLSHLVVPKIPIELEVAAQSQEECEPALVAHLNEMTGQFANHIYTMTHSCFNENDREDMKRLSGGQAVLRAEWNGHSALAREGSCVMISSEIPVITSNGDGKLVVTWRVGFAILDPSGFGCHFDFGRPGE